MAVNVTEFFACLGFSKDTGIEPVTSRTQSENLIPLDQQAIDGIKMISNVLCTDGEKWGINVICQSFQNIFQSCSEIAVVV